MIDLNINYDENYDDTDIISDINYINSLSRYTAFKVFSYRKLSEELFINLSSSDKTSIRTAIAHNKYCPIFVLEKLILDTSNYVLWAIATNKSVTSDLLDKIYNRIVSFKPRDFYDILKDIVINEKCPVYILEKYGTDSTKFEILSSIIKNKNCPYSILEKLLHSKSDGIRALLAEINNINILSILVNDNSHIVKYAVSKNNIADFSILEKLYNEESYKIRMEVALNNNCPVFILKKLSLDKNYSVRMSVALNSNSSEEILESLINDKCYQVRSNIARNKFVTVNLLKKLSKDTNRKVRANVVINENCISSIIEEMFFDKESSKVKVHILNNKKTPASVLVKLYKDFPNDVINHPNCPSFLRILSK